MKTAGIIGGLGPETTSEFYSEISFLCQEKNKKNRPPILIYSIPIPYSIEKNAIGRGKGEEHLIPLLFDAAKRLEKAGVDFLVMPCNSLHEFINEIRESVKIPVLSIIEETTNFLKERKITKVGIISTSITIDRKLYENSFTAHGLKQIKPDDFQQAKIGKIIQNLVSNRHNNRDRKELMDTIDDFETKGIHHIILACTDLQLLIPNHPRIQIFDTMKILADATVREILNHS